MKTAMILAAGRGERMRPLTDHTPKPLLEVGGKPLIVWHIEKLVKEGFHEIVINHAWLGHLIESTLGDGSHWGIRLYYSAETSALETAGGIRKALPLLTQTAAPFLVLNGDIWTDWSSQVFPEIVQKMHQTQCEAWILVVPNPKHHPQGDFTIPNPPTSPFLFPANSTQSTTATFAGIGIYTANFFEKVPPNVPSKLAPLLRNAIAENKLLGSYHPHVWHDIGTPERLKYINQHFNSL